MPKEAHVVDTESIVDEAVATGGKVKVFTNEGTTNDGLPRLSEGCEVQKPPPDESN